MGDGPQNTAKNDHTIDISESVQSIRIGVHRPTKVELFAHVDINLDKYNDVPVDEIHLDPCPRIRNVVQELEEEHEWAWPPLPPKDYEKARISKRQKCPALYNRECLVTCTIVSGFLGPLELLVAFGFMAFPKTFIPAMRESSEFCILFTVIFFIEGIFHIYAALLGCGLSPIGSQNIGFSYPSAPLNFIMPLLGLFATFISFYTTQRWRILQEMKTHLTGYSYRWFSQLNWDRYQPFLFCCGINNYTDWKKLGPVLVDVNGSMIEVPESCCTEDRCGKQVTEINVYHLGCLDMTIMGTNLIFGLGGLCMIVAFILAIVGYRSVREAEDYVGDPIHSLLFDMTSSSTVRRRTRAMRREELFQLLNTYCIMYGEELGLEEEVADIKTYLEDAVRAEESPVVSNTDFDLSEAISAPRIGSTTDLILEKFSTPIARSRHSVSQPTLTETTPTSSAGRNPSQSSQSEPVSPVHSATQHDNISE